MQLYSMACFTNGLMSNQLCDQCVLKNFFIISQAAAERQTLERACFIGVKIMYERVVNVYDAD